MKNRKKNGGFYWVNTTILPILDFHGETVEYISIRSDVTDLQETLKSIEEYERALNESSLVAKIDKDGHITSVNTSFRQVLGYSESKLLGQVYPHVATLDMDESGQEDS